MKASETLSASTPAGIAKAECAASRTKRGGILWGTLAVITAVCLRTFPEPAMVDPILSLRSMPFGVLFMMEVG